MRKFSVCVVILAAAIATVVACGSSNDKKPDAKIVVIDAAPDAKVWMDAPIDAPPVFDFSCATNPAPGSAADPVAISGTATEIGAGAAGPTFTMMGSASVDVCTGSGACTGSNHLGSGSSDGSGAWAISDIATGGTPLTAYITVAKTGDRTTSEYPAVPVTADLANVPVFALTPGLVGLLGLGGICTQDDAANGMMVVAVTDCANAPITDTANTTLIIKQGGSAITGDTVVDLGTISSMLKGTYLICNVPEATVTNVDATYMATTGLKTFLAHDVGVVKATTTATLIRPGY